MKIYSRLFYLLISVLLLNQSCTSTKEATSTSGKNQNTADVTKLAPGDPRIRIATEKFIEANKMEMLGDYQQAMNLYKECLKLNPGIDAAYYNISKILYAQKSYTDALAFVQQAVKLDPSNTYYLDMYGTLLGGLGNYKEAIKVYEQMVKLDPENPDAWYNYAFFTEQNKQYEDAIGIFSQIEDHFGTSEELSVEKSKLWAQIGKKDKGAAELQKLIDSDPSNPKYYSLLIDFYTGNGMEDKAYETLQQLIALDPNDPKAYLVLAGYYKRNNDEVKANETFEKAFSNPALDADYAVPILAGYLQYFQDSSKNNEQKKQQALELAKLLAASHPNEAKALAIYGDFLNQNNQFDEALIQYKKSLEIDNSKYSIWQQVFFLYDRERNYDSLLTATNNAIEFFPDQSMVYYFNGYANMQLKKYDAAVKSLSKSIEISNGDPQFLTQAYSTLGDAYNNLKKYTASDSSYDQALVYDPSNAYVLNNYSYYLSVRGEKLDIAQTMAEKANTLSPDNASYEDTYAWVLFKSGKYEEAKLWQQKALQHGGANDGTVLEHYGDILFKLNDVDGAVEYWMKAKAKNVESDLIDKKIAQRKWYE